MTGNRERERHAIIRELSVNKDHPISNASTLGCISNNINTSSQPEPHSSSYAPTPFDSPGRLGVALPLQMGDAPLEFVEVLCDAAWNNHLEEMRQIMKSTSALQLASCTDMRGM
jgi:hypothetical protein